MVYLETASRHQKATYWAAGTETTDDGRKKVLAATEITVRWNNKQSDAIAPEGELIRVDATVVVDRDVEIGSLMWLGEKADWSASVGGLNEVVTFSKVPNVKGTRYRRVVGLVRYSDSLPPIET